MPTTSPGSEYLISTYNYVQYNRIIFNIIVDIGN